MACGGCMHKYPGSVTKSTPAAPSIQQPVAQVRGGRYIVRSIVPPSPIPKKK